MKFIEKVYLKLNRKIKKIIESIIKRKDGGEFWSIKLRNLYKDVYGIEIGIGTYGCFKQEKYKYIHFGNYCSIASGFEFFPRNHPKNYASTHPMFFNTNLDYIKKNEIEYEKLYIGNDVWIGQDVKITNKCKKIGNGAIIGTGSVVTKDVLPYTIVAGNPAREIGIRFNNETIEKLEKSKWYDLPPTILKNYIDVVNNPEQFAIKIIKDMDRDDKNNKKIQSDE